MNDVVAVAVAITRRGGREAVAVLRREDIGERETPRLCLPGGRVEPGEPSAHAAAREVYEETGLLVGVVARFIGYAHGSLVAVFHVAVPDSLALLPSATEPDIAPRWVPLEELASDHHAPFDVSARHALEWLRNRSASGRVG